MHFCSGNNRRDLRRSIYQEKHHKEQECNGTTMNLPIISVHNMNDHNCCSSMTSVGWMITTWKKIQWNSDNKDFHNNFECHAWITVSQSYTVEELLKDTLHKLCKEKLETPLHNDSLIDEMRNHLRHKRYVVLFHDVWDKKFSDGIDFAIIDKNSDIGINHYFGHRLRSFVR